ncbi:class I SAM-dependent methyltransferase [Variovorax sp. J22P240]|uniref:class I SAM-dependent methyltransferase n=1 Tax=Variovorax sp. J22P240 TaxID=3053514 RepID=UPI0025771057|nr:class I SAM-dependent methyltransferase [Variovorax sp. J22P240]MDL9999595.1 class I SAM-dependent methyltransferase [Variovorax sp. J22P240]
MVTREEVVNAYLALLGREPESEEAVRSHCSTHGGVVTLISSILESQEYKLRHRAAIQPSVVADEPRTFTRDQLIKIYRDLLRRKPESEEIIASQLVAHRTANDFEGVVRQSEEFQRLQLFSSKRKIQLQDIDKEIALIDRLLAEDPDGYHDALNDFWLEIQPFAVAPTSGAYMRWVMNTYSLIANRETYEVSSEETDYDLESSVRRPVPYQSGNAKMIGDMLMAVGHVIHVMDMKAGASILEFGFGWGNTTVQLAMAGYEVTGIDIAPNFVEMVRRRINALGLEAELAVGDFFNAENLGRKFDAVLFFECFHHCSDHVRLLKAIPRILKPGGKLVLAGETINNALPYPWGVNPDGQAIYCIRKFGWLELSFRENYILDLLDDLGWNVEKHNFINAMGVTFIATRKDDGR